MRQGETLMQEQRETCTSQDSNLQVETTTINLESEDPSAKVATELTKELGLDSGGEIEGDIEEAEPSINIDA